MTRSNGSRKSTFLRWFGSLLSIVLLIYLLSQQGWAEIGQAIAQIPVWSFCAALLLVIGSRLAVTGRWHTLLQATTEDINWRQTFRLTFAGLFATNFLPTSIGGDIVRLAGAVQYGLNGAIVTASVVVDRLVGVFGMILVIPLGIFPLIDWMKASPSMGINFMGSLMITVPSPILKFGSKSFELIQKAFKSVNIWWQQPLSLVKPLIFTGIHMVCFFGILWILLNGLNTPIPFGMVAGLYSFVYLVTLLPISINSYGLQEVSISLIFTHVGGVPLQNALTVALIFRTLTMLASLPGAFFVPGILAGRRSDEIIQGVD